ncbi:DUF4407 domain-containing protein [Candidatus Synchoanobacter obligatus]|uniref:DUF4407 domain-containing protein n=1 Tax=Candidatus Synchoanobacter obligatus TaxID=2919597 RepID=A0ABT1L4W4_9GAMM|nr:DUF4407 domain-containing protein [Candidatus Synchoanobacter obligatus]MCP8352212.1 DUF4407 domain-containing protein [Candidatus Synchoanobacter obligatus]
MQSKSTTSPMVTLFILYAAIGATILAKAFAAFFCLYFLAHGFRGGGPAAWWVIGILSLAITVCLLFFFINRFVIDVLALLLQEGQNKAPKRIKQIAFTMITLFTLAASCLIIPPCGICLFVAGRLLGVGDSGCDALSYLSLPLCGATAFFYLARMNTLLTKKRVPSPSLPKQN